MVFLKAEGVSMKSKVQTAEVRSDLLFLAGLSGIAIAIGYIAITIEYVMSGQPLPTEAAAWVGYLDGKSDLWWCIIWCSVITDILYLPVAYALYDVYKPTNRPVMLASLGLYCLFVFLELAITWSKYPVLLNLVSRFRTAASPDIQQMLVIGIGSVTSEIFSPMTAFYTIFIPSVAVIRASLVMIRDGNFGKVIPTVGMVSGFGNAVSVVGGFLFKPLGQLVVLGSVLVLIWFLGVGVKMLQLRRRVME